MNQNYRDKLRFWIRFSGWFCLIPATTYLYLFQETRGTVISYFCIGELVIITLFAAYLLTTSKLERWEQPQKIMGALIFSFIFISVFDSIPLFLAYRNCKRLNG